VIDRLRLPGLPPSILLPALVLLGLASVGLHLSAVPVGIMPGASLLGLVVITCGVLSILAALETSATLRRTIAVALLAVFALALLARIGGARHPTWFGPHPSWHQLAPELAFGLLIALGFAIGGIIGRSSWARWLVIGIATAGLLHAGFDGWASRATPPESAWLSAVQAAGCLLLLSQLCAVETAASDVAASPDEVWSSRAAAVPWVGGGVGSATVAIPMLLAHAWIQAGRAVSLDGWDVVLACTLGVGSIATIRGRTWGLGMLAASGIGLLALVLRLASLGTTAFDHRIAVYYAAFWLPAAACSLGALIVLLAAIPRRASDRGRIPDPG
jgi:hypothetical protein